MANARLRIKSFFNSRGELESDLVSYSGKRGRSDERDLRALLFRERHGHPSGDPKDSIDVLYRALYHPTHPLIAARPFLGAIVFSLS